MGGGGGETTNVYQPTPEKAPSVGQQMNEYVESLPALYEAQMKYDPLIAQQQLEMMQQYGGQYGEAMRGINEALYPETAGLQEQMAGQATERMEAGVPQEQQDAYIDQLRSNLGTNVGSGIGADYTSRGMLQQQQEYQDYYRNLGLSLAGRQPLAQGQQPGTTGYMQQYQPGQALDYGANTYGSYSQASRPMALQPQQKTDWMSSAGSMMGGFGKMYSAFQ